MTEQIAFITGVGGQDGTYLAKLLLDKGYRVVGGVRRNSHDELARHRQLGIAGEVDIVDFELGDANNIVRIIKSLQPNEVYNLAAHSFVGSSWEQPLYVSETNAMGVVRLLDAVRTYSAHSRFYQASTSEMFGQVRETPQSELTPFHPRSPYAVSKVFAHHLTVNYRESFGLHASSGILFNHESPLRGVEFVTRKITSQLAAIRATNADPVVLGNVDASRDWGFAGDYVEGMWRMLQQPQGGDYVLATGRSVSIREFFSEAARALDFEPVWEGSGLAARCLDDTTGTVLAVVSDRFFRPAEVETLRGDATKAARELPWQPTLSVEDLASMMALADLAVLRAT